MSRSRSRSPSTGRISRVFGDYAIRSKPEFERVIVVAANEHLLPRKAGVIDEEDAVAKRNSETVERSLR
jgi:hypothetical protein